MTNLPQPLLLPTDTCYNHPGEPTCSMYQTPPQLPCYNIASSTCYLSTASLPSHLQHTVPHSKDLLKLPYTCQILCSLVSTCSLLGLPCGFSLSIKFPQIELNILTQQQPQTNTQAIWQLSPVIISISPYHNSVSLLCFAR